MPEKHSTVRNGKRLVWYTKNLWALSASLTPIEIAVSSVRELDEVCWFGPETKPTLREVADHSQRIYAASLDIPIILNDDGSLMDGGHRLCKAFLEGREFVKAVRFPAMPQPDEIHELDG